MPQTAFHLCGEMPQITFRDLAIPTKKAKPFNDPAWVFELKHDGYRLLLSKRGEEVSLTSRRGNSLTGWFPEIAEELRKLPDGVVDGELVMLDAAGKPEFHRLRGRCAMKDPKRIEAEARAHPAAVFAFDLLESEGKDVRALPLLKRKTLLQKHLRRAKRICYCQHVGEVGERLFHKAEELRLEGIIAKKADSPYSRGRTQSWLKIKTKAGEAIDEERARWNE